MYYWRKQNKGAHADGGKKGKFFGPARVLATGTKIATMDDQSQRAPSGEVWLSRGGRLIVAAHTQLRLASDAEVVEYQILHPREMPWTIIDGKEKLMPGQYEDIRAEFPEDEDFEMSARDVAGHYDEREAAPESRRVRSRSPRGRPQAESEARGSLQADSEMGRRPQAESTVSETVPPRARQPERTPAPL